MCIIKLEDGTTYYIDSDDIHSARYVVDYKLKQILDNRSVKSVEKMEGVLVDPNGKYYNSGDPWDGKELKCVEGRSYGW